MQPPYSTIARNGRGWGLVEGRGKGGKKKVKKKDKN